MLTKNLLRYLVKNESIIPHFINENNIQAKNTALKITEILKNSINLNFKKLSLKIDENINPYDYYSQSFKKLLFERLEFFDTSSIEDRRWEILKISKLAREKKSYSDFKNYLQKELKKDFKEIQKTLYADHPNEWIIKKFNDINCKDLFNLYNLSLVRTFLIFSKNLQIKVNSEDISIKRAFIRSLKFHRLLCYDIKTDYKNTLKINIGGPLNIFQNSQSYGIRISNFFPNILRFKKWDLNAIINISKKDLKFNINQDVNLKPIKNYYNSYIPEEFKNFKDSFNEKSNIWKVEFGNEFINLGKENYIFPDFIFKSNSNKIYLELFHKWHSNLLLNRLKILNENLNKNILIGVSKKIIKEIYIESDKYFKNYGFMFNDFPVVSKVLKLLDKY